MGASVKCSMHSTSRRVRDGKGEKSSDEQNKAMGRSVGRCAFEMHEEPTTLLHLLEI